MLATWICAALIASVPVLACAGEQATVLSIEAGQMQTLRDALLELVQQRLPRGLIVDRRHAWMTLSGPLTAAASVEVYPQWSDEDDVPALPLKFELRPVQAGGAPIQATLAVRLQQEVLVATRRLHKGSVLTSADLAPALRDVIALPKQALSTPYTADDRSAALRDIAVGEVLRSGDIGPAPAVLAGLPVIVSAASGTITVSTSAVALTDANVGDLIDVRLQRPTRTLRTRVVAPGMVRPLEAGQ